MSHSKWKRNDRETLALACAVVTFFNREEVADGHILHLSYKQNFIGLTCQNKPLNFMIFKPKGRGESRKSSFQPRCPRREDLDRALRNAGLGLDYRLGNGRNRYAIKLSAEELDKHGQLVLRFAQLAYSLHHPARLPNASRRTRG